MKFTPKINPRLATAVLAVAGMGGMAWLEAAPAPTPDAGVKDSYSRAVVIPAVEAADLQGAHINYIHWYNSKSWWKRNAPIVGGAAGGGLIGGLAGGGKGALIGGAAGAGGGALYKHYKGKHHHGEAYRSNHGQGYR